MTPKRSLGHFVASTKRCCPKRCDVLFGTPSFQAAGFHRGFVGQGSCARVSLPPGRTAFLAFLFADFTLKTVPFDSDLLSFNLSLNNGKITGAMLETSFNKQTSTSTGSQFKPQRFVIYSISQARTDFQDFFGATNNITQSQALFSIVPEASTPAMAAIGISLILIRRSRTPKIASE